MSLAAATTTASMQPDPASGVERILLTAGRSMVLEIDFPVTRVAVTDPDVADVVVVAPREILVDGKTPGTISLFVWGAGERREYAIVVDPGVSTLELQLQTLFPGEDIRVSLSGEATVLFGEVSSNIVSLRAAEVAAAAAGGEVINLLQLPGGSRSQQVMLQVRFAEVNHRALTELGISMFATRPGFTARATTQGVPAPDFDDVQGDLGGLVFSDFLNLFFFQRTEGFGAVIRALKSTGSFQSLAEPNLIAYNGEEASFLAGGEFPVPIVQGNSGSVSVQFKEFGIRLSFTPTIAGDMIRLRVRPEVSTLDFANGITLAGFRIPALTTRRAETVVELRDGQSFAIAGLLDNVSQTDAAAIPLLSRLPIIGGLFKSKATRAEQTELLVLITPRLVRPLDPDEVPPLPINDDEFLAFPDVGEALESGGGLTDGPPPGGAGDNR